jgi:uncharacterized protein (AIM24 family)
LKFKQRFSHSHSFLLSLIFLSAKVHEERLFIEKCFYPLRQVSCDISVDQAEERRGPTASSILNMFHSRAFRRFASSAHELNGIYLKSLGFGNILHCKLAPGTALKARLGACIGRSADVRTEPMLDGILSAISRSLTGAPFFLERFSAEPDTPGELFLSPRGWDSAVMELDGSAEYVMRGGAFLACSSSVRLSTARLPREFLADTGLFGLTLRGQGLVAVGGYGKLHRIELLGEEEYVFNRRNLIAWSDQVGIVPINPMTKWSILLSKNLLDRERLAQALAAWGNRKARYCMLKGPGVVYMSAHVEHKPPLISRSKFANKASPEEIDYQIVVDHLASNRVLQLPDRERERERDRVSDSSKERERRKE